MWCKLLCSSRSSRRADRLAEKSTGSDVNWFQLRSSFSRKDKDKNACGKRGKYPERQREASIYCIITSSSSYFFCFYRCKQTPSILPLPSLAVQHWSSDCLPSSLILWYLHFIPFTLSLHLFLLLSIPSVQLYSYLWLYFLYLAAGQHQHTQGPQSSEGLRANLAQIVSSQLQQPCAVWDTPGNMLEP